MKTVTVKSQGGLLITFEGHELSFEIVNDGKEVTIQPLYPSSAGGTTTLPFKMNKAIQNGNQIFITGVSARLDREVKCEPPKQEDTKTPPATPTSGSIKN